MKKILHNLIPVFIGLALAAVIIFSYFMFFTGAFTPEKAVTGYIKASMMQDADNMVKYASDYQKVKLFGKKDFTDSQLKEKLEKIYADAPNTYEDSSIAFSVVSSTELNSESEEYKKALSDYEDITGKNNISAVTKIVIKVFVDGKQTQKNTVYAVKSGLSWYYGF